MIAAEYTQIPAYAGTLKRISTSQASEPTHGERDGKLMITGSNNSRTRRLDTCDSCYRNYATHSYFVRVRTQWIEITCCIECYDRKEKESVKG